MKMISSPVPVEVKKEIVDEAVEFSKARLNTEWNEKLDRERNSYFMNTSCYNAVSQNGGPNASLKQKLERIKSDPDNCSLTPLHDLFLAENVQFQNDGRRRVSGKQSHRFLTLAEKVDIIKNSVGRSQRTLAKEYGIGKTAVQNLLKKKDEILSAHEQSQDMTRKRLYLNSKNMDVNRLTWLWYKEAVGKGKTVTGPIIQERALFFAKSLGKDDFKASKGWLNRFKARNNILNLKSNDDLRGAEANAVTEISAGTAVPSEATNSGDGFQSNHVDSMIGNEVSDQCVSSEGIDDHQYGESNNSEEDQPVTTESSVSGECQSPTIMMVDGQTIKVEPCNNYEDQHLFGFREVSPSANYPEHHIESFEEAIELTRQLKHFCAEKKLDMEGLLSFSTVLEIAAEKALDNEGLHKCPSSHDDQTF